MLLPVGWNFGARSLLGSPRHGRTILAFCTDLLLPSSPDLPLKAPSYHPSSLSAFPCIVHMLPKTLCPPPNPQSSLLKAEVLQDVVCRI